jgi:hypothetical protein
MYSFPDPKTTDPKEKRAQRFWEAFPGILTWGTFLFFIIVSFLAPIPVSIFLITYNLYWIFVTIYLSVHLVSAYRKLRQDSKKDWFEIIKKHANWDNYIHLVILLTYNEPKEVLEQSVRSIEEANYDKSKMIVVVATEEREGKARDTKEKYLTEKFQGVFKDFIVTKHPDGIEGEMKAKGANATYAAKEMVAYLKKHRIDQERVILSTFDSDTIAHKEYFAALTHEFIKVDNPYRHSYQPLPMYHNNIWTSPAFARVIAVSSTFWHMMESVRPNRMVTFSSHSMSFKTLVDVNYWPVNIVSDDSVIYWKCVDYFDGEYSVIPIHIPVSLDAVEGRNIVEAVSNQYKQIRRWAYGIEDLAVVMRSYWKNKKAPFGEKLKRVFDMIYGHYTWATTSPIIAFFGWIPIILGGEVFRQTVLSNNLPIYTGRLMTIALTGLFLTGYLNALLLPKRPEGVGRGKVVMMFLQWALVPVVTLFLGAIPAIEAQTRLMLGKYLGFWVTPKNRK